MMTFHWYRHSTSMTGVLQKTHADSECNGFLCDREDGFEQCSQEDSQSGQSSSSMAVYLLKYSAFIYTDKLKRHHYGPVLISMKSFYEDKIFLSTRRKKGKFGPEDRNMELTCTPCT